jgi:hypothetical protein
LFTPSEFISSAEVKATFMAVKSTDDEDEREKIIAGLQVHHASLFDEPDPDRSLLTSSVVSEIDRAFMKYLGSKNRPYGTALVAYKDDVQEIFEVMIRKYREGTESQKIVCANILGKFKCFMTHIEAVDMEHLPLMTPSALMSFADMWSKQSRAIQEVSI